MMEALMLSAREFFRRIELRGEIVTDPLTGLSNARGIHDAITGAVRHGAPFCLLFLDLDNFKQVNDRFGHAVGDELLKRTGESLRLGVRTADLIGRLGGDEFVVVLAETPPDAAVMVARRLARNLDKIFAEHVAASSAGVSVSLGIAAYPIDGDSVDALLDRADKRMYVDKRTHKPDAVRAA
jgi:diguanylate cyclase (GGDEF)-like protein